MNPELTISYNKKHNRFVFLSLIALFSIPFIFAWLLYTRQLPWNEHTTNRGTLLTPLINIQLFHPKVFSIYPPIAQKGSWSLVYYAPQQCDEACIKQLHFLRQIQIATGKDQARVARIFLAEQQTIIPATLDRLFTTQLKGTSIWTINNQEFKKALSAVKIAHIDEPGTTYIVDPMGNLVLAYHDSDPAESILKDLKHLLYVSRVE